MQHEEMRSEPWSIGMHLANASAQRGAASPRIAHACHFSFGERAFNGSGDGGWSLRGR